MRISTALFIARMDIFHTLKDRTTLVWLVLMPGLFFYFIGLATGGSGGSNPNVPDNIALSVPADAGFLADQIALRLEDAEFHVVAFASDSLESPP